MIRTGFIERRGKIEDLDRSFDLHFWHAQQRPGHSSSTQPRSRDWMFVNSDFGDLLRLFNDKSARHLPTGAHFVGHGTEPAFLDGRKNLMAAAPTIDSLIEKNPELRGGRPVIAGTGTTVRAIAGLYKLGLGAEEIATQLPHLELAQIYAALTYYHLNVSEIEADIDADSEENLKRLANTG